VNDILKEIDTVFRLVSSIPVTGDSVDTVAVIRAKLRSIHGELKNMEVPPNEGTELQN
jgi:hypothetical protein